MIPSLLADLRFFVSLIFLSIILTLADSLNLLNYPKSKLEQITIPIQYGLYQTSHGLLGQFEFVILAGRAYSESKLLREQLALVLSENSRLRRELAETQATLAQRQTFSLYTFDLVSARPIGISRYLVIDKGSDDGLKVNQSVIYKDNFIGKIDKVTPKRSFVLLSSDPDSRVSAFVSGPAGKARGVLVGQFGAEMLFDKILHQEKVKVSDLVYTEGGEIEIPRGLILGQVFQVLTRDNEVFKQAKVRPIFQVADLDIVFVITN